MTPAATLDVGAGDRSSLDGHDGGPQATRAAGSDLARVGKHPLVRVPTLALGGLLAVVLLLVTGFTLANLLVRTTESDSTTFAGPVARVKVSIDGNVTITAGPATGARLDRRSTFGLSRPHVSQTLVDGVLEVDIDCPGSVTVVCNNDVHLQVPPDASLTIDALGARVVATTGPISVRSGAGEVALDGVSGDVDARVGGGAVVGRDLRSARVRASAAAGSVDLRYTTAPVEVEANSGAGSVVVAVPRGAEAYQVLASAGGGDDVVAIPVDPQSHRVIRATAGAGSVEVRYTT